MLDTVAASADEQPVRTQLYRHFDKDGRLLYVGISLSTAARLAQHKDYSEWFASIANVTIETFPSRSAALEAEAKAIESENPLCNIRRPKKKELAEPPLTAFERTLFDLNNDVVRLNATYSPASVADMFGINEDRIKEYIDCGYIGYVKTGERVRKNKDGQEKIYPIYLITGWQLLEFFEYVQREKCLPDAARGKGNRPLRRVSFLMPPIPQRPEE